jgi:hypothetical protein
MLLLLLRVRWLEGLDWRSRLLLRLLLLGAC